MRRIFEWRSKISAQNNGRKRRSSTPLPGAKARDVFLRFRSLRFNAEELRHVAELLVAGGKELFGRHLLEFGVVLLQSGIEQRGRGVVVGVRAALGFRDGAIDAA